MAISWRSFFVHRYYRRLFAGDAAKMVLADLAEFCNVHRPTARVSPQGGTVDPIAMAIAEGRREVFLRIQAMLNLTNEEVAEFERTMRDRMRSLYDQPSEDEV